MDWLYYFLMLALLVCGLGIQLMSLPGLWLMAAAAGMYALISSQHYLWPGGIAIVLGLCVLGELLEFLSGAGGAKKAGGSRRAMLLGTIGGVMGGILLSIPVPIIGTVAGVCLGAFVGATAGQLSVRRDVLHSTRVGFGAAKGTLVGIVLKLCVGVVILLFTAWSALPLGASTPAPLTSPTSAPGPDESPATAPSLDAG